MQTHEVVGSAELVPRKISSSSAIFRLSAVLFVEILCIVL